LAAGRAVDHGSANRVGDPDPRFRRVEIAEHDVAQAIAIDVGQRDGRAEPMIGSGRVDIETVGAIDVRELQIGRKTVGLAVHDVDRPGVERPILADERRADDEVIDAVAVDVSRGRNRIAAAGGNVRAVNPEAVGAVEIGGRETCRIAGRGAVDDVGQATAAGSGVPFTDDEIVKAIAIDIAGGGNLRAAGGVDGIRRAFEMESVAAVDVREFDSRLDIAA